MTGDARDVRVTIFGDDGWTFTAAVVDGERWNGWAVPWFTEAEGRKVAAASARNYDADPEGTQEVAVVRYTETPARRFWLAVPAEHEEHVVPARCDGGVWLYGIGAANWTWQEAESHGGGWAAAYPPLSDGDAREILSEILAGLGFMSSAIDCAVTGPAAAALTVTDVLQAFQGNCWDDQHDGGAHQQDLIDVNRLYLWAGRLELCDDLAAVRQLAGDDAPGAERWANRP